MKKTCSCCDLIVCAMPAGNRDERDARRKAREAKERAARAELLAFRASNSLPAGVHAEDGSCCPTERDAECACSSAPTECEECARFFALHPAAF